MPDGPVRDVIRRRRLVRFGERFTSDELEHGDVELELPPPSPEPPEEEQVEPWGLGDDVPEHKKRLFHGRLLAYVEHHGGDH